MIESTVNNWISCERNYELERFSQLAQQTINIGTETKLKALKMSAEFDELKDGRGKLLIFTEHRDTLEYLKQNLTVGGI